MKTATSGKVMLLLLLGGMLCPPFSFAWYSDPKVNSAVAPSTHNQINQTAVSDGAGGEIVTWAENVDGTDTGFDIFAQRIDSSGNPVWPSPVAVCTAADYQGLPRIVSDGTGGAIIVWHDSRDGFDENYSNFDIYAQRVSGDGTVMWAQDGIPICTASSWQVFHHVAPDGFGGAIISWDDGRSGNSQVYVQRVNREGQILWNADGVLVADTSAGESDSELVSDGAGGALIVWNDYRALDNIDIYAQKITSSGTRQWGTQGVPVCNTVGDQFGNRIASDGSGGGIVVWTDNRTSDGLVHVYAQRITTGGSMAWPSQGLPITANVAGSQKVTTIISDGIGGAIFAWEDGRRGSGDTDIYAQRITNQGVQAWGDGGAPVVSTQELQIMPMLISDGSGGAFFTWQDYYRGGTLWNVYSQHLDGNGKPKWKENGVPVCIADGVQSDPYIISDGSGGVIITWYDGRSGVNYNIFAQQVNALGLLGGGEFRFYTADTDGNPKTIFTPGELILFKATWTAQAAANPGTYQADSAMVINSSSDFRSKSVTYDVK